MNTVTAPSVPLSIPAPSRRALWGNMLLFQSMWFAVVLLPQAGLLCAAALLALHFVLSAHKARDAILLLSGLLGLGVDIALVSAGSLSFTAAAIAPTGLVVLWAYLAVSLAYSLAWLHRLAWPLQALLGAIAGPFAYAGAQRLGALEIHSWLMLSVAWAVLMPVLLRSVSSSVLFMNPSPPHKEHNA